MKFKKLVEEMLLEEGYVEDVFAQQDAWDSAPSARSPETGQQPQNSSPAAAQNQPKKQTSPQQTTERGTIDTVYTTVNNLLSAQQDIGNNLNTFIKKINNDQNLDIAKLNPSWYKTVYDGVLTRQNISRWLEPDIYPYYSFIDFIIFCYSKDGMSVDLDFKTVPENINVSGFSKHIKTAVQEQTGNNSVLYYNPYSAWLKSVDVEIKRTMLNKDKDALGHFFILQCAQAGKTVIQTLVEAVNIAENKNFSERNIRSILKDPTQNTNVPKSKKQLALIAKSLLDINNPQ